MKYEEFNVSRSEILVHTCSNSVFIVLCSKILTLQESYHAKIVLFEKS